MQMLSLSSNTGGAVQFGPRKLGTFQTQLLGFDNSILGNLVNSSGLQFFVGISISMQTYFGKV